MNPHTLALTLALAGGTTLALAQAPPQPAQPPVTSQSLEINSLKNRIEGYKRDIIAFNAAAAAEQKLLEADMATLTQLQTPPAGAAKPQSPRH